MMMLQLLAGVTNRLAWGRLGQTNINPTITPGQGFGVEILGTSVLVFTVFACIDHSRHDIYGSVPLTVGIAASAVGLQLTTIRLTSF